MPNQLENDLNALLQDDNFDEFRFNEHLKTECDRSRQHYAQPSYPSSNIINDDEISEELSIRGDFLDDFAFKRLLKTAADNKNYSAIASLARALGVTIPSKRPILRHKTINEIHHFWGGHTVPIITHLEEEQALVTSLITALNLAYKQQPVDNYARAALDALVVLDLPGLLNSALVPLPIYLSNDGSEEHIDVVGVAKWDSLQAGEFYLFLDQANKLWVKYKCGNQIIEKPLEQAVQPAAVTLVLNAVKAQLKNGEKKVSFKTPEDEMVLRKAILGTHSVFYASPLLNTTHISQNVYAAMTQCFLQQRSKKDFGSASIYEENRACANFLFDQALSANNVSVVNHFITLCHQYGMKLADLGIRYHRKKLHDCLVTAAERVKTLVEPAAKTDLINEIKALFQVMRQSDFTYLAESQVAAGRGAGILCNIIAELKLDEYIAARNAQGEYSGFPGKVLRRGHDKPTKLAAADQYKQALANPECTLEALRKLTDPALVQGDLGKLYEENVRQLEYVVNAVAPRAKH